MDEANVRFSQNGGIDMASTTKSVAVLLLALLVLGVPVAANGSVSWGVNTAANRSAIEYDEKWMTFEETSWGTGFSVGLEAERSFTEHVAVVSGLRYLRLSARTVLNEDYASGHFDLVQSYASLPLSLRYYFGKEQTVFFEAGVDIGVLLTAVREEDYDVGLAVHDSTIDIRDKMDSFNYGVAIGLGIDISASGLPVQIRARYVEGLAGVADSENWFSDWRVREIGVGVSYVFWR